MKQKRKIIFVLISISTLLLLLVFERYYAHQTIVYPNFGISIPAGYSTHGIDVSRYQRKIEWEDVVQMRDKGQRISFAIAKSTEGTTIVDPTFKQNWNQMHEHNLMRGAYLYFHPNRKAAEQAQFFIKHTELESGDLPPVVDIEERHGMSSEKIRKSLKECLDALEQEYDAKPIIYTGADFYEQHLGEAFDSYPLWVAHYEQNDAPRINRKWIMWQHNCKGHVNGIRGEVDFNVVNGNLALLQSLCL